MASSKKILNVFVNQIGYEPKGTKYAYARGLSGQETFSLLKKGSTQVVYSAKAGAPKQDRVAGESICTLDFSDFNADGEYIIRIQAADGKTADSVPFKIGKGLYNDIYSSSIHYFYLSRCGFKVADPVFGHPECHAEPAVIYGTDIKKEVNGGWHDAGDYGRYIVAGSKAVMDLLLAYEGTPRAELLDEIRFELEWMLKMQRSDGGVFHKVSCYHFCGFIKPQDEKDELVIAPVSSTATADFAGCLAFASGFFKETDSDFADKLMAAALKAWDYLETHEDEPYKNPPEITTGGYGDWSSADERYFACGALFLRTGEQKYVKRAKELKAGVTDAPADPNCPWKNMWLEVFGWGMVAGYGTELFLRAQNKIKDKNFVQDLKASMTARADKVLSIVKDASFGTALDKVRWGSCGQVCDDAHTLLAAYDITGNKEYYEGAKKQLDYVLGCNPMDICYVTGFGTNTVKNPHHRPSVAAGQTMPGMVSGGPCEGLYDEYARKKLEKHKLPPLQCFIDHKSSYSTNEIAIYWNSTFVYVASKLKLV